MFVATLICCGVVITLLLVLIISLICALIIIKKKEREWYTKESKFCYTISCPCDNPTEGPCKGYAKRPGDQAGSWYCSSSPNTLVDNNGKPL